MSNNKHMLNSDSNLIDNNLKFLKDNINNKLNDEHKFYELMYITDKLSTLYVERYSYKELDEIIKEYSDLIVRNSQNNISNKGNRTNHLLYYDKGNFEMIFKKLSVDEGKSLYNTFINNFSYEGDRIKFNFKLNKQKQAVFNEAKIKTKNNSTYDIRGSLQYLTLEQLYEYLDKSGFVGAKRYIAERKNEFEYKKVILKDLFDYIMYSIMKKSPDINGAKIAIIFALHFNADMRTPVKYSLSTYDENNKNIIDLYKLLYKDDIKCYIDYFDPKTKHSLFKKNMNISKFEKEISKEKNSKKR